MVLLRACRCPELDKGRGGAGRAGGVGDTAKIAPVLGGRNPHVPRPPRAALDSPLPAPGMSDVQKRETTRKCCQKSFARISKAISWHQVRTYHAAGLHHATALRDELPDQCVLSSGEQQPVSKMDQKVCGVGGSRRVLPSGVLRLC